MLDSREALLDTIKDRLTIYASRVRLEEGKLADGAEELYRGLLDLILDCNLRNMNQEKDNFPGIDLGDDREDVKLAVQVTSTGTRKKVRHTLKEFFENKLHLRFTRLIVLVIGDAERFDSEPKNEHGFDFQTKRDIWDTKKLKQELEALSYEKLEEIAAYLKKRVRLDENPALLDLPLRTAMDARNFVGRERELAQIEERFRTERIVVLSGLGGMGKTELAVRFAQSYGGGAVYFAGFRKDFFHTVTDEIALGVPGLAEQKLDEQEKYQAVLKVLRQCGKHDLLILDNADSEQASFEQLRRDLSVLPMRVLITTRCDAVGAVDVASLHREELHRIFRQYTQEVSEADMDALIGAVDAHTLTVDLMARLLRRERRKDAFPRLLDALGKKDLKHAELGQIDAAFPGAERQVCIYEHLRTVFQVSKLTRAEQTILRYAALLPADGLDSELFASTAIQKKQEKAPGLFRRLLGNREDRNTPDTAQKVRDILAGLADRGWLDWKGELLHIHPVIRIVCREELGVTDENCASFLKRLRNSYGWDQYDKDKFRRLAELFTGASYDLKDPEGEYALWAGNLWLELAEYERGKTCYQRAVEKREMTMPDTAALATVYDNLGISFSRLGDHTKALEYKQKALSIREKVLPPEHPDILSSFSNLSNVHSQLDDHEKALEYGEKALAIRERAFPADQMSIAISYNNVGTVYGSLGNWEKQIAYLQKALAIWEQILPPEHPRLAIACNNVGCAYSDAGNYEKALEYHRRAMFIRERSLPPEHPDLARSYNNLGNTYVKLGDYEQAQGYGEKALAIYEKVLPPAHLDLVCAYGTLGDACGKLGDYGKALEYHHKALAIQERRLPADHPQNIVCSGYIAIACAKMDDFAGAAEYARRAWEKAERSALGDKEKDYYRLLSMGMELLADRQKQGIPFENPFKQ